MINIILKSFKINRGFTVLESIVAIFILSLSITGIMGPVQKSLSQATIAKDEVRAFYEAQEAIELVRNLRDKNQLKKYVNGSTVSWLDGITQGSTPLCPIGRTCAVDVYNISTTPLINCGVGWGSCAALKYHPTAFISGYTAGWVNTNFVREIQFEQIPGFPNEIAVTVRVSWTTGSVTREFKAKTHLFNWI